MKIAYKLLIPIVVLLSVSFAVIYLISARSIGGLLISSRQKYLSAITKTETLNFTDYDLSQDPGGNDLRLKFKNLRRSDPAIFRIKVWDSNLKIVYSDIDNLIGSRSDQYLDQVKSSFSAGSKIKWPVVVDGANPNTPEGEFGSFIVGMIPLKDSRGKTVFVAELYSSTALILSDFESSLGTVAAIFGITVIMLAILEYLILHRFVIRPIKSLKRSAKLISSGDFRERVNFKSRDEFGILAEAMNIMAVNLRQLQSGLESKISELEDERAKLSSIAQSMILGAILLDENGQPVFLNRIVRDMLGLGGGERETLAEILPQLSRTFPTFRASEEIGACVSGVEFSLPEIESADGKIFHIFSSCIVSPNDPKILGHIIWLQDMTKEKTLEREKNEFVAIAAHEMRTPLTIIRGNAELILSLLNSGEKFSVADVSKKVSSVQSNSIRLLGIVNDFLDVMKFESGKITVEKVSFGIDDLVGEVVADMQRIAATKQLYLNLEKSGANLFVLADNERTRQVLVNLISNALHYTEYGGVTVKVQTEGGFAKISVSDTGVGIEASKQSALFKKFSTIANTFVRSKEYGSGLGLYIAKTVTEAMGGKVLLLKSAPGTGSIFTFTLPLAPGLSKANPN